MFIIKEERNIDSTKNKKVVSLNLTVGDVFVYINTKTVHTFGIEPRFSVFIEVFQLDYYHSFGARFKLIVFQYHAAAYTRSP